MALKEFLEAARIGAVRRIFASGRGFWRGPAPWRNQMVALFSLPGEKTLKKPDFDGFRGFNG